MEMLKFLRLAVCVACIAAFASGCGGGGGGGTAEEMTPVMECPQGQVGTYPDCMDPPPTDAELIADAQDTLAGILADAQSRVGAARSAAAAVRAHDDATDTQIANANANLADAESALADILAASGVANTATTPAQANGAVADARTALGNLTTAGSAVASILSAVNAVAEARRQREADEAALTGGSSLIKHLRDNKLLADAVLGAPLAIGSIVVGEVGATARADDDTETCTAPCAIFPGDTGSGATRVTGQRTVTVQGLTSNSTTPSLSGTGRLPHGFDLKNADGSTFVNAYTDISKTRLNVRTRTGVVEDNDLSDGDARYENRDFPDTDYLLAGIWITVDNANLSASRITAFAYGSQDIEATSNFCVGIENSAVTGTTTRTCADTTGLNQIDEFVDDGQDFTATYTGDANGAYLAGTDTSYFTADVTLTAEFQNPTGGTDDGSGSIEGSVTNIVAGGQSMAGSIELQEQSLGNTLAAFEAGTAVGVVDGKSFSGEWKGQFFGYRVTRTSATTPTNPGDPTDPARTITTTYSPEAPGSVAGTFYATQQSNPAGSAAFIGSFAANR